MTTATCTAQKQENQEAKKSRVRVREVVPPVDVYETEDGYRVLVDLPGVKADDLDLKLQDGKMSLRAEAHPNHPEVFCQAYDTVRYARDFTLGKAVDQGSLEASLANGVLRVNISKVPEVQPRKIEVKTAG